jgi:hypothetical protein
MKSKPLANGLIASISLSGIYFIFLLLIGGIEHALGFISSLWYWLAIIIAGFGLQFGLYTYIRQKIKSRAATVEVSTSMGVSTGSMVACCLHLAVNLFPLIGLSALTIVLTTYQTPIILIGVFSNIIGVVFMISVIKKHKLYSEDSKIKNIFRLNFKTVIIALFFTGISTIAAVALTADVTTTENIGLEEQVIENIDLEEQTIESNKVAFSVTPEIDPGVSIRLLVSMNTHSVNLNFDMLKVSKLVDSNGEIFLPAEWQGPAGGGHHRSGTLIFLDIPEDIHKLNFLLSPGGKFQDLNFEWIIQ